MPEEKKSRLLPATRWNEFHVWPTIGSLRYLVANAKEKGFENVFVKANGRILIDEDAFFQWAHTFGRK